ncbi:protein kinase domain protein [Ichthyophthirius multifiliis]|uniref:Protein kinase domain protein n=1 Tax=Ichthyophthirius multifiliis TaxID=5932 RepID=G0R1C7_ICHMU|nr:protein kinase domain protein [Ichthyophthirius multifiliis]EGR28760.1 protein kinase domain protein [Ichthyophthirius multifiliis]|eukprot:XP_004029996.1 protein kinase domain protein [Ichthyophthirius multifiliis]
MEYIGLNSLHYHLKVLNHANYKKNIKILEGEAKRIYKQIIQALDYLHQNKIAHRDIKLDNILLDKNNNVKLIDFGFSVITKPYEKLNQYCGSLNYMSSEILEKKQYLGFAVDVWASGVLLYVILCGTFPFKGENENEVLKSIQQGLHDFPYDLSQGVKNLFQQIFNQNQQNRITTSQVLLLIIIQFYNNLFL